MISLREAAAPDGSRDRTRTLTRLLPLAVLALTMILSVPTAASAATPGSGTARAPLCPPECGAFGAGDPLLVPYLVTNPGPGWFALPATAAESYAHSLTRYLRGSGPAFNVADARWIWVNRKFDLVVALVSSDSLAKHGLEDPARNAEGLCNSTPGVPTGRLLGVPGIPDSVVGICDLPTSTATPHQVPANRVATIVAFDRGNVAVLMEITSATSRAIDPRTTVFAAQQQYASLPASGVLVSQGVDLSLVVFWICLLLVGIVGIVLCARRRGSWYGPIGAIREAFVRRRLALGVTVIAVVGAMAFSMLDSSLFHGVGEWSVSTFGDFWRNWDDAGYVTHAGGYGHLYELDRTLETPPSLQVLLAPFARIASGLSFPNPGVVLYPSAYWVAGPLYLGMMALPICAGDRWLQFMGVTELPRRLTVLGIMAVTLPPIALTGHPEDLIALGAMLYGLVAAMEGRHRAAGWWLGTALAFQFLAFLAVPMALVFLRRRQWLTAIVPMVILPLAALLVPLASQPGTTVHQILHQKVYNAQGYITPTWDLDPGVGAFIRLAVALLAIPAALVVARHLPKDRQAAANLVVWTLAALFCLRVFEPELFPYFLAPGLALFAISASRRGWWRLAATGLLCVWLNWWLHIAVEARWSYWLILIAQLGALAVLGWPAKRVEFDGKHAELAREHADAVTTV